MKDRITLLDSFRAIAILSVILFHFFSRYSIEYLPNQLYPYTDKYDYFSYGSYGVQLFFIISGFVITSSLHSTNSFSIFWKKRLIRLLPSIFIASMLTLFCFSLLDYEHIFPESHEWINLIPSLSFINPRLFQNLGINVEYISLSYWSLWPEIQFYFLASTLYFLNKGDFFRNFLILSFLLMFLNHFFLNLGSTNSFHLDNSFELYSPYKKWVIDGFNLPTYLPFFAMGVIFNMLFVKKNQKIKDLLKYYVPLSLFVLYLLFLYRSNVGIIILIILFVALFMLMIYKAAYLRILKFKLFSEIGKSSYFLYLIHENIGVILIILFGTSNFGFILPILLIVVFILFSVFFTNKIETPFGRYLSRTLISSK